MYRRYWSGGGGESQSATPQMAAVTVDFGHAAGGEESLVVAPVSAPWVTGASILSCLMAGVHPADHDPEDAALDGVSAFVADVQPGVGFNVVASAVHGTWGRYLFNIICW